MSPTTNNVDYSIYKPLCLLALILTTYNSQPASAQIYRWQDDSGKFQYSDKPHPGATLIKQADEKKPDIIISLPDNEAQTQVPPATESTAAQSTAAKRKAADQQQAQPPTPKTAQANAKMSERDQTRLKELSRKHKRCASSRTRLSKLQTQHQQRKLEGAPKQTLDYLQRSIDRQNKLVSRDCQ